MSSYIFESNTADRELHRLRMLERARDPSTIQFLERTGIRIGWKCLELGPGAGSMLKWVGEKVGPAGLAIGVDKNPTYLRHLSSPPYDIRRGDFLDVDLERPLDLVYGRNILIHNKDDEAILRKIWSLLKPDGYLFVEEPDFSSANYLNDPSNQSHKRVNSAICKMFLDHGLNPAYGIHLPQKLEATNFQIIETLSTLHLCQGNTLISNLMGESARALSKEYVKTGEATKEDIQQYEQNSHNPEYWSVYFSSISVLAKPAT